MTAGVDDCRGWRRVAIIGPSGAGKSTLARRLAPILNLPVIHFDTEYWQPGWIEPDKRWWRARTIELASRDRWIIDGNFGSTMSHRLHRADAIIFLDFSRWRCMWGVIKRVIRYHGKTRPDLPAGCPEKWDWEFVEWVLNFPEDQRPQIVERLAALDARRRVFTLHNDRAVDAFVKSLEANSAREVLTRARGVI